mgnify:CR=1 FL=1
MSELSGSRGLNLTKSPYLRRLRERQQLTRLKQQVVFGLTLGWIITLFSGFQYLFAVNANDSLWKILLVMGVVVIALAIVFPSTLAWIEKLFRLVTQHIGEVIFSLILITSYILLIVPVGLILQWWKGTEPFYSWQDKCTIAVQGWVTKEIREEMGQIRADDRKRPLIVQSIWVVAHFFRSGNYLFIPVLTLMLVLGLVMFFVKTSSLAPFIYTLF